jgi:hypothetical protein
MKAMFLKWMEQARRCARSAYDLALHPALRTRKYSSRDESVRLWTVRSKKKKRLGGVGAADEEACTVHTVNIISQRQYLVARCLIS